MSFILDALKKSEIERQRQSMPGLIDVPVATRRRVVPAWVWVLVGLLGVTVAVLLVLLLRNPAVPGEHPLSAAAPPVKARAAAPPEKAPSPGPDHFSPLDSAPVYAPEIPVQEGPASDTGAGGTPGGAAPNPVMSGASRLAGAAAPRADPPARAPSRRADTVLNDEPSDDNEMLPSINELNLSGNQSLPEIHLDVHVYATRSADRFVYINMRKYREGAVLQEGPTLERIRRDGVVLNSNGLRFFVPRQS